MNGLKIILFGGRLSRSLLLIAVCSGLMLAMSGVVSAQSGCTTTDCVAWYSIDGGAKTLTAGTLSLRGTLGQLESSELAGGLYTIRGGITTLPSAAVIVPALPAAAPVRNYFAINVVTLSWNRITNATGYRIEVAKNSTFTVGQIVDDNISVSTLSWSPPTPLLNGTYYWRIRAKTAAAPGYGPWSPVQTFVVNAP